MRIGYGKLGRATALDEKKWGVIGGDHESRALLLQLAERNPEHEFVIIGRRTPVRTEVAETLPGNIVLPDRPDVPDVMKLTKKDPEAMAVLDRTTEELVQTIEGCDAHAVWLGQHGASSFGIPKIDGSGETTAMTSFMNYVAPFVKGFNRWQDADPSREVCWMNTDVRNWLKMRDLKWHPRQPILCQADFDRRAKSYRFGDTRPPEEFGYEHTTVRDDGLWDNRIDYRYSGIEVSYVQDWEPKVPWEERGRFGVLHNGAPGAVKVKRGDTLREWAVPAGPDWIVGKWAPKEEEELGFEVTPPVDYFEIENVIGSVKCMFLEPALGYGWVTPKVFEAFSCGTVPFVHPGYDKQGKVLPTIAQLDSGFECDPELAHLARWLRPQSPEELETRIDALNTSRETWEWLSGAGFRYFRALRERKQAVRLIEARLGLREDDPGLWVPSSQAVTLS